MLAIDFAARRLRVVVGRVGKGQAQPTKAFAADLPDDLDKSDAAAVGSFLKEALSEQGVADRQAVATIDRRNLILKTASLADVARDEVAEVVRLQAMRELTMPIDEAIVDYRRVELGGDPFALLAVARGEVVEFHRKALEAAGLTAIGIWPGPVAQVHAARAALQADFSTEGDQILVVQDPDGIEVSLLRGGECILNVARSSSGKGEGGGASPILQGLRRLKASIPAQHSDIKIERILLADGASAEPDAAVAAELAAPVVVFDPLRDLPDALVPADQRGAFAESVGALYLAALPAAGRIDFLKPKKPVVRPDRRRLLAIAVVGVVLLGGFQAYRYRQSRIDAFASAAKTAKTKEQALAKELKSLAGYQTQAATIEAWRRTDVVWLDVLRRLTLHMPDKRKVFVTQMNLSRGARAGGPVALIRVEGFADSPRTVSEMIHRLTSVAEFEVRPGTVQPAGQIEGFPWRFSADVGVPAEEVETVQSLAGR